MGPRPLLLLALIAACGPAPTQPAAPPPVAAKTAGPDICEGSPPVPHPLAGILRGARCEQDMYWSMSQVADQLGVDCTHCHAHKTPDVKSCEFPPPTPKKE